MRSQGDDMVEGVVSGEGGAEEGVSSQEVVEVVVVIVMTGVFAEGAVEEGVPLVEGGAMEMTTAQGVAMEEAETTNAAVAETAMAMITMVAEILGLQGIAVARQLGVAGIYSVKST